MRVNLADVTVKDFTAIPKGTYTVNVTDGEIKDTKDGPSDKNPTGQYINWELTVDAGEHQSRKLWKTTPLGGDGLGFLKEFMIATGKFDESEVNGDIDVEVIIDRSIGAKLLANVAQKENPNSGEMGNDVRRVRPYEADTSLLPS